MLRIVGFAGVKRFEQSKYSVNLEGIKCLRRISYIQNKITLFL